MITFRPSRRSVRIGGALAVTGGLLTAAAFTWSGAQAAAPTAPTVGAKGMYLLDTGSGKEVAAKGADTKRPMASTTKLMTAAVVLDSKNLDLDRKLTVKQSYRDYVTRVGASTADLRTGDKLTVRQMLYALLLPSGCDAAMALADAFGSGSTEAARIKSFESKMNQEAADLGMKNSSFDSFDGNSTGGRTVSTPRDLAKLARHAMAKSTFRDVVKATSTQQEASASNGHIRTYTWINTNKLLGSYKGATGVKTGTNTPAGPCLIFAGTRGDRSVVGVLLNDTGDRFTDAGKLMDFAFGTTTAEHMKVRKLPAGAQRD